MEAEAVAVRVIDCPCGHRLAGAAELLGLARGQVDRDAAAV